MNKAPDVIIEHTKGSGSRVGNTGVTDKQHEEVHHTHEKSHDKMGRTVISLTGGKDEDTH